MSHSIVIQYGRLEELIADIQPQQVIRVIPLDITEAEFNIPGLRVAAIGVHVRTITPNHHILSCYLPVASVQAYDRSSPDSEDRQQLKAAWGQAEALQQRIITWLQSQIPQHTCEIRTDGIIHLEGIGQPLHGQWKADPDAATQTE